MKPAARFGWLGITAGLGSQAAAYLVATVVSPEADAVAWLTVVGISATLSGILLVGACRRGRISSAALAGAVLLFIIPLLGFGSVLLLGDPIGDEPLLLSLPRRAAVVLLGVGLLPVLLFPLVYATDRDEHSVGPDQLEEFKELCRLAKVESDRLRAGR